MCKVKVTIIVHTSLKYFEVDVDFQCVTLSVHLETIIESSVNCWPELILRQCMHETILPNDWFVSVYKGRYWGFFCWWWPLCLHYAHQVFGVKSSLPPFITFLLSNTAFIESRKEFVYVRLWTHFLAHSLFRCLSLKQSNPSGWNSFLEFKGILSFYYHLLAEFNFCKAILICRGNIIL